HLEAGLYLIAARGLGHAGGEIAAGAVAADRDARRIDVQLRRVGGDPTVGGDAVVIGGGELVLRRQAIVDRDDGAVGLLGEQTAERVVAVQAADRPAAAVIEDEGRLWLLRFARHIDAGRDVARGAGDPDVLDLGKRYRLRCQHQSRLLEQRLGLG